MSPRALSKGAREAQSDCGHFIRSRNCEELERRKRRKVIVRAGVSTSDVDTFKLRDLGVLI